MAVGFAQYFTGLPVVLVSLHLLGAALLSAAMTWLLVGIRDRAPTALDQSPSSAAKAASGRGSRPSLPNS